MKKYSLLALVLCFVLAMTCLHIPAMATVANSTAEPTVPVTTIPNVSGNTQDLTITYGSHTPDGKYPVHGTMQMIPASKAAILYEINSDCLVYSWNADTKLYPSSLVKIMTALLAIEEGNLDDVVTADWDVLDTVPVEAMKIGIQGGEELTIEQLLYAMIVGSGNDAAALLADHIAGSQAAFVDRMNQRAGQLGCTGTVYTNVTGLHDDAQVTTARDMVKILRKAMEYPVFAEIFTTDSYTLPATNMAEPRYLQTTNYMQSAELTELYYDERVTGGRTGVTNDGLRCLAVTAQQGSSHYICIILEAKSDYADNGVMIRQGSFEDASMLLDIGFEQSEAVQVLRAGQAVEQLSIENSSNDVVIGPQENVYCVVPVPFSAENLTFRIQMNDAIKAPVEAGTYVAEYQVWYRSTCIATAKLYTLNGAKYVSATQQVNPNEGPGFAAESLIWAFAVLGIIFVVIALLFLGLLLSKRLRSMRINAKRRNRRQNRRRSK